MRLLSLLLCALSGAVFATTTAVVTPGTWDLYRGSTKLQTVGTEAACVAAAIALNVTRLYSCRYRENVQTTYVKDVCGPSPAPESQSATCPAGTTGTWAQTRTYVAAAYPTCWTAGAWSPTAAPVGACTAVPPPPSGSGPTITLNPATYAVGGYSTIEWRGIAPCNASAVPAYAPWSGSKANDWAQSVAPNVSTVFTITCADGTRSAALIVTGSVTPPPGGGGGDPPVPPPTTLPVPTVLPTPIALTVVPLAATDTSVAPALKFAETARRNWNFDGNVVADPFAADQGYWNYEDCQTHYSVWLFDRPTAWFRFAELTGNATYRALAISDFKYWAGKIGADGYFSCKAGEQDTKYLYIEPFLLYEAATGDTSYRPVADRVYAASATGLPLVYSTGAALWTEREVGIHLDAALGYWKLKGDTQALARAAAYVKQWTTMAGTVGAPLVTYTQHEGGGPGGTQPTNLTNSPWMSAMYFQAARKYWQVTGDNQVLTQASKYFDWLDVNGYYNGSLAHPELTGVTLVRYLTGELIGDAGYGEGDMLHCPDNLGFLQFAMIAKTRLGLPTARVSARLSEIKVCSERMWANWTRPATTYLPKYRIQSPRAWNWWMRGIYDYSLR